jgi:hypothetical protein
VGATAGNVQNAKEEAASNSSSYVMLFGDMDNDDGDEEVIDPDDDFTVPHVENTLCVNAENYSGSYVYTSFSSYNDEFTFTGDSQIAHTGSAVSMSLLSCSGKTASTPQIEMEDQGECTFDYEAKTNYCSSTDIRRTYLMSSSGQIGEPGDKFDISWAISTNNVYFRDGGAAVYAAYYTEDPCQELATGEVLSDYFDVKTPSSYKIYVGGSECTNSTSCYDTTNDCDVDAAKQVTTLTSTGGKIDTISNHMYLVLDWPAFVYTKASGLEGTEVNVKVTLNKYPCGKVYEGTIAIGSFVTACTSSSGTSTVMFPVIPGSGFTGWWYGWVIANGSSTSGTADCTFVDSAGNKATYTTATVPAGGHLNLSTLASSDLTQVTGTVDFTKNFTVVVDCNFDMGGGMCMLGNGEEGVGYAAYSTDW